MRLNTRKTYHIIHVMDIPVFILVLKPNPLQVIKYTMLSTNSMANYCFYQSKCDKQ